MKRFLFCILISITIWTPIFANLVVVDLLDGRTIEGEFVSLNDSVLVIKKMDSSNELLITSEGVFCFRIEGEGKYVPVNGKFYPERVAKEKRKELQKERNNKNPSSTINASNSMSVNQNFTIGKVLRTSGVTALGIGVPCLAAGVLTCIAGRVGVTSSNVIEKGKCVEASYYLLGTGSALTIVGIPLYYGGKKIMELNVNFNGTGAGLALAF